MARLNFVKKARKDYPESNIKKGDSYYWWKFNFGRKQKSRTKPPRSRLTQSSFYSQLWDIQDTIAETITVEGVEGDLESLIGDLQNLLDECQESLDAMPEQLQESSAAGQTLSERIENMETYINELEAIDTSFEETDGSADEMEARLEEIVEEISNADPGL